MERVAGAWCEGSAVCFRLPDHDQKLASVRLVCAFLGSPAFTFDAAEGRWELRVARPPAARIEYKLELTRRDGRVETICDQGNPRRAPGGFGESSVVWCPDYREPDWLHLPPAGGEWTSLTVPMPAVRSEADVRIWSPATPTDRILVAHDGPDYERYASLGLYAAASMAAGRVQPFHVVLLPAAQRFEWYAASTAYAKGLASEVVPKIRGELGSDRPVIGIGASLGALAMLHAQRRHPAVFGGLFLQSGSFFQPRFDAHESGFARYQRIVRFVGRVVRSAGGTPVPTVMTCGAVEENLANNRAMAAALREQGYPVTLAENRDAHTWIGWRDALDPHLTSLVQRVWP
nr:alpha/beta hydrolase-fold protein [uncultured Actinoplanes sp.]